jgi:hypothetical protein
MFIRINQTQNSPRKSVQIVESKRDGHKVRTKILRHVGIAMDDMELQKLKSLAQDIIAKMTVETENASKQLALFHQTESEVVDSLKKKEQKKLGRPVTKKIEDILPIDQVTLDKIVEEKRVIEGVEDIGGRVYNDLGLSNITGSKRQDKILKDIVLSRLVAPYSKHKLSQVLETKFDKPNDLDAIYRMMDALHPKIDAVKTKVFESTRALIPGEVNLMLFDVTTLYFESVETDDLRKFGYSKDHRFNTTQVVLALCTNGDGLPLGYELFSGNTAEVTTLIASITKWRQNFNIKEVCFVGDRAMFSEANLKLLDEHGYQYIVAAKLRNLKSHMQNQILNEQNYKPVRFGEELGWVGEFKHNDRRLISSYKTKRAVNDAKNRQRVLDKIDKLLAKSSDGNKLISNHGIKKYTKSLNKSKVVIDQAKVDIDAVWDGVHGVITNIKYRPAQEILSRYASLWAIEESFRINKHTLKMRPIYHWKKERIESHIAICYMSFAVLRSIQYRVRLTQKISVDNIIEELLNVQASIYVHADTGDRYRVPGHVTHNASKIYKALGCIRSPNATVYLPH